MECLCLSGAFRRRGGAAALLALARLGGACDNVDFTVYVRVSLGADPDLAATGVTIPLGISQHGATTKGILIFFIRELSPLPLFRPSRVT